jgi:hypothetical protein
VIALLGDVRAVATLSAHIATLSATAVRMASSLVSFPLVLLDPVRLVAVAVRVIGLETYATLSAPAARMASSLI